MNGVSPIECASCSCTFLGKSDRIFVYPLPFIPACGRQALLPREGIILVNLYNNPSPLMGEDVGGGAIGVLNGYSNSEPS
jgi:hypothetical protein